MNQGSGIMKLGAVFLFDLLEGWLDEPSRTKSSN